MNLKHKLLHAVTEYDRRQSGKRGYNMYALPQYLARVDEICADVENGADLRRAITAGFMGRLADACLRAVGLPITTDAEARGGSIIYTPAAKGVQP